jgi:3-isopropylmalate dehydrogenase
MAAPVLPTLPTTPYKTPTSPTSILSPTTPHPSTAKTYRILVLPGDHVGPEVMDEALRVLDTVQLCLPHKVNFELRHEIVGGGSIDKHGVPITEEVLRVAKEESDAVLFGSVGGPKW